ncbi:hypothetical protein ACFWHQ_40675 [Streptomyces sp. NPDC060334]|uniref:hypothetical protein n=1 Tax=Streptomyces sp. NPDC060334 TaxID=3347099 RepID=UPI00364A09C8
MAHTAAAFSGRRWADPIALAQDFVAGGVSASRSRKASAGTSEATAGHQDGVDL